MIGKVLVAFSVFALGCSSGAGGDGADDPSGDEQAIIFGAHDDPLALGTYVSKDGDSFRVEWDLTNQHATFRLAEFLPDTDPAQTNLSSGKDKPLTISARSISSRGSKAPFAVCELIGKQSGPTGLSLSGTCDLSDKEHDIQKTVRIAKTLVLRQPKDVEGTYTFEGNALTLSGVTAEGVQVAYAPAAGAGGTGKSDWLETGDLATIFPGAGCGMMIRIVEGGLDVRYRVTDPSRCTRPLPNGLYRR